MLLLSGITFSHGILATEGGAGHYLPGSIATLMDIAPDQSGWVIESMYLHYEGDASSSKKIPIAGAVTTSLNVKTDALTVGTLYSFEQPVFGATYTVGAFLPYVRVGVGAELVTTLGTLSAHDSESGIGDLILFPVMLAWKSGNWQYDAFLPIYAPTGDYKEGRLANPGLNYWSFDPTVGFSYSNDKTGFNAALHGGITFNTENSDTDYRSGSVFHLDGSIQQLLPLGPGFLSVGAEVFYLDQVSDDSSDSDLPGGFRGRTAGVGPVLDYILPEGDETLVAELRWLPELDVKNRVEGDYIWLKLVYQF